MTSVLQRAVSEILIPNTSIEYRENAILLTFTGCANRFCSLNLLSLKTDAELPILVVLEAASWKFKQSSIV
jgi:hypothetical protein